MFRHYFINRHTSALATYFHNGYEYSEVLEGTESFLVAQSPEKIVKESFLQLGGNLEGAIEASGCVLQQKYKLPIVLSAQHQIALIRCPASNKSGTIWLVDSHIDTIETDPDHCSKTLVHTNNGYSFTTDMKFNILQTKRTQATFLISIFLKKQEMNRTMTFYYEKDNGTLPVNETEQLNFTFKKKNMDLVKMDT